MKRNILLTIFFTALFLIIMFPGLQILSPINSEVDIFPNATKDQQLTDLTSTSEAPAPLNPATSVPTTQIKQTGWIPDWAFNSGYQSFTANYQYFDSISPVWYYLEGDGQIRSSQVGYDQIRPFTSQNSIKLIPSIANFDADQLHFILSDPQKLQNHVNYLISEISQYNYDGIDLDYESIYLSDMQPFQELVSLLHDYLSANDKMLSISVMPVWTSRTIRTTLRQTVKAQNWGELAQYADEIRIMTYNLTDASSTYPGPIAPLDWMEAVLRYAVTKVDMSKVILGINLYGYDGWANNQIPSPYLGFNANPYSPDTPAIAYNYKQISEKQILGTSTTLDPITGEPESIYTVNGTTRIQYYADANFVALRAELAKKYGVKGLAYWRLGNEDPETYAAAAK